MVKEESGIEGNTGLIHRERAVYRSGINLVSFSPAILSDPRLSCHLTYTCDPVRRTVTVERTVGKVMLTLRF